jgi:RimJ/RimL family protein N-acetyltransferase
LQPEHLAELCVMHRDERVMATLGGVRSDAETRDFLRVNLDHWDRYGYGLWIFRGRAGAFAGRGGIRHVTIEEAEEIEVAYALMPDSWGRGLATEMAEALLDIASILGLSNIIAYTLVGNRSSQRVLEKLGFRLEREFVFKSMPHLLYRRPRESGSARSLVTQI